MSQEPGKDGDSQYVPRTDLNYDMNTSFHLLTSQIDAGYTRISAVHKPSFAESSSDSSVASLVGDSVDATSVDPRIAAIQCTLQSNDYRLIYMLSTGETLYSILLNLALIDLNDDI